jgi:hypothetical protein
MGARALALGSHQQQPLLSIVVQDLAISPPLTGLCAGYELGRWRAEALADHLLEALPDFCLTYSEANGLNKDTAVALLRQAAKRVYTTKKFAKRGEFGELLLHVILKQVMKTLPAISKIYYKDANNDTVKGFDAVHVVVENDKLELWLGEAKFYEDATDAIREAVKELREHTEPKYLRGEFYAIKNKLDDAWPHAAQLKSLLHGNTSLDKVFSALCIPVLLTYDGSVTAAHTSFSSDYVRALTTEMKSIHQTFASKTLPPVRIHLFLLPTATKAALVSQLDAKLKTWQQI